MHDCHADLYLGSKRVTILVSTKLLKGQFKGGAVGYIIDAIDDDLQEPKKQSFILSAVRAQPAILTETTPQYLRHNFNYVVICKALVTPGAYWWWSCSRVRLS